MSKAETHHSKNHSHHHHHHHHSASGNMGVAFFLNLTFALIELVGGFLTNSLAILSDGFHDLGDCFAIGIAWFLEKKSLKGTSKDFSYGYRRLSVMAALITGMILVSGSILIIWGAVPRLFNPVQPEVPGMIALACLGLFVNGFSAWKMSKGHSLNERMILVHLLEDVAGWAAILIGALVMAVYPIPILDPIMAIAVALWVLWNAFRNLRETVFVFLQATPRQFELSAVESSIRQFEQVSDIHHTHVWSIDGEHHILTAHVIVKAQVDSQQAHALKAQIKKHLFQEFHIQEATLEIEWPDQICADPKH